MSVPEQEHYNQAPIVEAVIELGVDLSGSFDLQRLAELEALWGDRYGPREEIKTVSGPLTSDVEENTADHQGDNQDRSGSHPGYHYRSTDALNGLTILPSLYAFSVFRPYDRWSTFATQAKDLWRLYCRVFNPTRVTRVGVRYINEVRVPTKEFQLETYFNLLPKIVLNERTKILQQSAGPFFLQMPFPQADLDALLVVTQAQIESALSKSDTFAFLLDIDLIHDHSERNESLWRADDPAVWDYLERLHSRKNEMFEALITEETRKLIR